VFAGATVATVLTVLAPAAYAQATYGTYEQPLEGRRYESMRALANYVDEAAQDAIQAAREDARRGSAAARRLVPTLRAFGNLAADFHDRLDNYDASALDAPDDVDALTTRARRIDARLRASRALGSTAESWADVIDGLDRMKRVLAGQEVEVPPAYGDLGDYDRDYGPFGRRQRGPVAGAASGGLTGNQVEEFHQLAHALDTAVSRAHQVAWQHRTEYAGASDNVLNAVGHLADKAADLHRRADSGSIDPREIRPIVSQLLTDAQQVDRTLRSERVFPQILDEWSRALDVINRMAALVR
jgi:hypothetical protein